MTLLHPNVLATPKLARASWGKPQASRPGATLFLFAALVIGGTPSAAQSIRGIVENETGGRLGGAVITVLGSDDSVLVSALSDPIGRFELRAPGPGRYRLRVHLIGYGEHVTDGVDVSTQRSTNVRVVLSPEAIELEGLSVEVDAPTRTDPYLDRRGFYDRWKHWGIDSGWGTFLDRRAIEETRSFYLTELVRASPGIRVNFTGGRTMSVTCRNGHRAQFYINGHWTPAEDLNTLISTSDLAAVEIYPGMVGPMEWGGGGCKVFLWTGPPLRGDGTQS